MRPVVQHPAGQSTAGVQVVLAHQFEQLLAAGTVFHQIYLHHIHVAEEVERVVAVVNICHTAAHTGSKVSARLAEHHDAASGHILTAVVSGTLHHSYGTRVAHSEALAHPAVHIKLTACGSVESGVARDDIILCSKLRTAACRRQDGDAPAGESLAKVVVGFALKPQVHTAHGESSETLSRRTLELDVQRAVGQSLLTVFPGYHARKHRAHGTVGVADGIVERHLLATLNGGRGGTEYLFVLHSAHGGVGTAVPTARHVSGRHVEQTAEIHRALLGGNIGGMHLYQVRATDDILELPHTKLAEIFADVLSEEGEEVDHIVGLPEEPPAQHLVLSGHTHGAGVGVALAHHHTTQYDKRQCAERELICAQHRHDDHILRRLQLTVGLQAHLIAQTVDDQRLLRLRETYLRRDTGKTHARCRRCARTALGSADDDEVGFCLRHTGGNGAHTALRHQFHTHGSRGIDILEIEDELGQVLDTVYVVMRRRRNEADTGNSVASLGNNLVHLETGQLTALAGLRSLCHLDLYLLGVHQILSSDTEASAGNLLCLARKRHTVHLGMIAHVVLTALTGIAAGAQTVHCERQSLVSLNTQSAERHSTRHKVSDDALHGFHLINGCRSGGLPDAEIVADENGTLLPVHELLPLLEFLVAAEPRSYLETGYRLGIPGMEDSVLAVGELSVVGQVVAVVHAVSLIMQTDGIPGDVSQSYTADGAHLRTEIALEKVLADTHALEYLRTAIGTDCRDTHLRHYLLEALVHSLDIVGLRRSVLFLNLVVLHKVVKHGERHIRTYGTGTVAQQQCCVHHLADFPALHYQSRLHALAHTDEIMVHGTHGQQTGDCCMAPVYVAVAEDDVVHTLVHAVLSLTTELLDGFAQSAGTLLYLEEHRKFLRVETLVSDVAEDIQLRVCQHRLRQTHHLAVGGIGSQYVGTHSTDILRQRHHQFLTYRVDSRIGHLGELLTEIVEEHLRTVADDSQRSVVTHSSHGFLTRSGHRYDGPVDILLTETEAAQLFLIVFHAVLHMAAALEFLQLYAVSAEPLAIGMLLRQFFLDFAVVVYLALLSVDKQYLARLQTSLTYDIARFEVHHSHLTCHHHHTVPGDGVAAGTQTVAVEHTACITAVAEQQGSRTVPRFHQYGVVLVECLQILGDGVLLVEGFRHQYRHRLRKGQTAHYKKFEHVVQRGGIRHTLLHNGTDIPDVSQSLA